MNKTEARGIASTDGWSRKLGYSKRELGVETPKNGGKLRKRSLHQVVMDFGGWVYALKNSMLSPQRRKQLRLKRK